MFILTRLLAAKEMVRAYFNWMPTLATGLINNTARHQYFSRPDIPIFPLFVAGEDIGFQQAGGERRGVESDAAEKGLVQCKAGQVRAGRGGQEEDLHGQGQGQDV